MPYPEITAIIPASGKGIRFGKPKKDALWQGKPFVEHIQATLEAVGIGRIIVADSYETPDMLSTLRLAIKATDIKLTKGYLIFPVDHPFVTQETISVLCATFMEMPDAIVKPSYDGQSGHPVLIPIWLDLEKDDAGQGLAGLIRSQACTVIDLPVDDEAVLRNVNLPQDLV